MTNVLPFPKPYKKPQAWGSGRRTTERDRLALLLFEIRELAQHSASTYKYLHERVKEFNELAEIDRLRRRKR